MSYREENGQVVLTMSRDDYATLLLVLGGHSYPWNLGYISPEHFQFMNRLNEGNPNYTPYQVEKP